MLTDQNHYFGVCPLASVRHLNRSVLRCVCLVVLLGHTSTTSADTVLFQTGFEPPSYGLGSLAGQDNWLNNTSVPFVQSSNTFSGNQAVQFGATGLAGQTIIHRPIAYNSVGNPESIVKFTAKAKLSDSVSKSNWNVFTVFSDAGFLVQILVQQNRVAKIISSGVATGDVFISPNVWNDYELNVDFSTQLAAAFVNGQFLGQRPFHTSAATNINLVGFGVNSLPGADTIFYDDLRVASVPEPGSMALLTCGAMLLLGRRRRRKI